MIYENILNKKDKVDSRANVNWPGEFSQEISKTFHMNLQ